AFTVVDTGIDYSIYAWKRFDGIKGTAGGGLSIALASYMDLLLEAEYTSFLTLDSFENLFVTSIGFRFTI
ncbi:MAG: hypothetical protein JW737_05000, partial [Acidobacteria bacterium]|nr:hypothetical protein [Acidobacteriota bacterium]